MSDQVTQAFVDLLRSECERQPVLLVLEDLHWGDALTVKLADSALRDLDDQPLMILAVARPEVDDLFPRLWGDRARHDIRLGGLSKRACERLIQQVLGNKIDPKLQGRIIEQAAGNALFLEELMRAVAEGKQDELPETVLTVLHARLMRLVPDARRVLRAASVFGETFWDSGVRKLLGNERNVEQFGNLLQSLVESEIIERRRDTRFPGEVEYLFRHNLVREAAYGMLPDEDRLTGHYLAGCYLEAVGETDPMVLAEHFQRSRDYDRAIVLYTRATEQAYERNDLDAALRRAERGLSCGAEAETRGALYALQTAAWFWRNDLEKAFRAGSEALTLLTPSTTHWFLAMCYATTSAAALGKQAAVSELAVQFGTVPPTTDARGRYIEAAAALTVMLGLVGDREMAELFRSHSLEVGGPVADEDPYIGGWMHYPLGRHANALQPTPWAAVEHFQKAAAAFQAVGDRRMAACALGDLGFALARLGDAQQGEVRVREAVHLAQRLDEPSTLTWVHISLAFLRAERRHEEAAQQEAEQLAKGILSATGEGSYYRGAAYCVLAAVHCAAGSLVQAEAFAHQAIAILRATQSSAPLAFIALGRVLIAAGRADDAVRFASEGVALVDSLGGSGGSEVPLRLVHLQALKLQGNAEQVKHAQAVLDHQLQIRAAQIPNPERRDSFLVRHLASSGALPLF